jgi:hypothetical protein
MCIGSKGLHFEILFFRTPESENEIAQKIEKPKKLGPQEFSVEKPKSNTCCSNGQNTGN